LSDYVPGERQCTTDRPESKERRRCKEGGGERSCSDLAGLRQMCERSIYTYIHTKVPSQPTPHHGTCYGLLSECHPNFPFGSQVKTADPAKWLGEWVKQDGTFFNPGWYMNYYKWGQANNGLLAVDSTYLLKTNTCGFAVTKTDKVSMFFIYVIWVISYHMTSMSCTILMVPYPMLCV
jgi:hypothetical protein